MGAAFAGIIRVPLTSVIMIFEITRDYTIIVPLMISNLIAFFISQRLQPEPIYEALASQEGVHLPTAHPGPTAERMQVRQTMRLIPDVLPSDLPVEAALHRLKNEGLQNGVLNAWPVTDESGLRGMI